MYNNYFRFEEQRKLVDRVSIGETLTHALLQKATTTKFGGRALRRFFQAMITDKVSDRLLSGKEHEIKGIWKIDIDINKRYIWEQDSSLDKYLPEAS